MAQLEYEMKDRERLLGVAKMYVRIGEEFIRQARKEFNLVVDDLNVNGFINNYTERLIHQVDSEIERYIDILNEIKQQSSFTTSRLNNTGAFDLLKIRDTIEALISKLREYRGKEGDIDYNDSVYAEDRTGESAKQVEKELIEQNQTRLNNFRKYLKVKVGQGMKRNSLFRIHNSFGLGLHLIKKCRR